MPMPQLTERIKEAPAMALRAMFAGVGQVLLAVDKIRSEVLDRQHAPEPPARPGGAAGAAAAPSTPPSAAEADNVRMLREEQAPAPPAAARPAAAPEAEVAPAAAAPKAAPAAQAQAAKPETPAKPDAAPKPAAARKPAASRKPAAGAASATKPRAAAKPAAGTAEAPLPNYDELTVASLRARMRSMDAAQVRTLLDYERAHANREAVVAMYERRLAKIAAEAS